MSEIQVATIITPSHLDKAYAMLESLRRFHSAHLHVLIMGAYFDKLEPPEHEHATFYRANDIFEGPLGTLNRLIFTKYNKTDPDRPAIIAPQDYLRWALKPGFVRHLLEEHEAVTHCDCDLFFYDDPIKEIERANNKGITLSPHWRTIYSIATDEIQYNFRHGLYNGGFFIATRSGNEILKWWAERCCVECSASSETTYVDQKYLDLVPLYFDGDVGIIRHKGYNVAAWNANYLKRTFEDGRVLVDGDEIVFIHFSPITIRWIEEGLDFHLTEHLAEYQDALTKQRIEFYRQDKQKFMSEQITAEII